MRDLTQSMNAGVGSSRSRYGGTFARKTENGLLQFFLYARFALLDLPSGIGRAVVFDNDFITRHIVRGSG